VVRELYATGIAEVAAESLASDWRSDPQRELAVKVFALADGHGLTWAREDMFGNIFALEDTIVGNAIADLMTPLQAMKRSPLLTNTASSPPQIMIDPHPVSRRWAGVALGHELVHVHDVLEGVEPAEPDEEQWFAGEARAYRWEAQLVDALTGSTFADQLAEVLVHHPLSATPTTAAVQEAATGLRMQVFALAVSVTERAQQDAFCSVALLFERRAELWSLEGTSDDNADLKIVRDMK
jgi:hypothetical protein